jgi:hypothetical protein
MPRRPDRRGFFYADCFGAGEKAVGGMRADQLTLVGLSAGFSTIPAVVRNLHGLETIDDASLNFLDLECTV